VPKVEFFHTSNDQPLHFDVEEDRYVWRQYTRDSWYVRVDDPYVSSVFVRVDEEDVPLEKYISDNCFTLSEDVGQRIANGIKHRTGHEPNPGGWVALLDLWSDDGNGTPQRLDPPLYIEPGNLSSTDFNLIIERLQDLAGFRYSPTQVKREASGGSTEGGTERNEDELLKQAADKFLALIKQVHSNWVLIQETASRETQLLPKFVDIFSATGSHSSRLVAKKSQRPYARRVEILMPQESLATVENRFLVYVLESISQKAPLFKRRLSARSKELREEWIAGEDKEGKSRRANPLWQQKQTEQWALADCMAKLAEDIDKASQEVIPYINDPFLREVRDSSAFPSRPTDRLTRSFAYGPVHNAFCDYQKQPGILFAPLKPGLMRALETRSIHPACTLYELWVFVELYDMLTRTFGFRLPADAPAGHPFDFVDSTAGEIIGDALQGHEFRLEFRPNSNEKRLIKISLFYDTQRRTKTGSNLRPDLFVVVSDSTKADNVKHFAVDAKYHSYPGYYMRPERDKHGVDTVFDLDLLITAKEKYRGTLRCDAAFVVHSDSNANYTYWGGSPYKTANKKARSGQEDVWPEHHYGSVFASPSDATNLRKLLKCFLMYHLDADNICWSCNTEVEPHQMFYSGMLPYKQYDATGNVVGIERVQVEKEPVGRGFQCEKCQRSWTRTWCRRNKEHKIYKIGADSFHSRDGLGRMICPTCGDGYTEPDVKTQSTD